MLKVIKKPLSLFLALLICIGVLSGIPLTVSAAVTGPVYYVAIPRGNDPLQDGWGHPEMPLINGWHAESERLFETKSMDGFSGNTAYCIEVGINLNHGDILSVKGEDFWDNYPSELNSTLSPIVIKAYIGRIMQYGWTGQNDPNWNTSDPSDVEEMAEILATQLLIWETVIGERDANFNHVNVPAGTNRILDLIASNHPLKTQIYRHYDTIASKVQNHTKVPSFCTRSSGSANNYELTYNGSGYTVTLTDTNNVLSNYNFSSGTSGVTFSASGNKLTVNMSKAPTGTISVTAEKKGGQRRGVITWTDGITGRTNNGQLQDVVTYGESVSDPVNGFFNLKVSYGSAKIIKTSEDGKVNGITFTVSGNGINKTVTTNASGQVQIDNLTPGVYTVTEQSYDKYEPQNVQRVTIVSGQTSTVTFNNKLKRGSLTVTKTSEDSLVSGLRFRLHGTSLSGGTVDEYATTDSSGKAYFNNIPIGTGYVLEEVNTPNKYIVPEKQSANIEWNKVTNKSFHNTLKRGNLTVTKTSEDNLTEGVKFHLYGTSISGITVDKYAVTDRGGKAYFKDILIGNSYSLEEVGTELRYIVPAKQEAAIEWNKVTEKSFENILKRGDLIITKDSEDGLVEGMKFHLYGMSLANIPVDEYAITDSTGKAYFRNILISGDTPYTVEEVETEERYITPLKQTTVIEWSKVAGAAFENILKRGDLVITKNCEDGLSEGIKFHLYGMSLANIPVDEYAVTDSTGKAYFKDILISGDTPYTVEEVDIPIRYVIPEAQTAVIEWQKVTNKTFVNYLKRWNLTLTKSDSETGTSQGDASLAGAKYGIYKGVELVDVYTTDANGSFVTNYYVCGYDWSVREIDPSEGYLLNNDTEKLGVGPENYTVRYNHTALDVTENVKKGNIVIIKHTNDGSTQLETPEVGAEFEVFLKKSGSYANAKDAERDILTCDEHGFAQTKDLPYGVYRVHQIKGWDGREFLKDFYVFVSEDGQTYRYLINNANFESYIKVIKTDAESGLSIPYAGAAFQLYDPDGNKIVMSYTYPEYTEIDTFYTTADGMLITPQKLEYGKRYSLVEVSAPYGYVLDSTPINFDVAPDTAAEDGAITVVKVSRPNMPQKGIIKITKTGEIFQSVTEQSGIYQPAYEIGKLSGAVFEIHSAEDICTLDGVKHYAKGELVDTVTTGSDGIAVSKQLYLGKYEIQEITAPHSMVLNDEIQTVELTYARQEVTVTEVSGSLYNDRQKVQISLDKTLEQNEVFSIGMNGEISNISFGLYAAENIIAADGTLIPADGLIEIITFNSDGHAICQTDLPLGKYYLQEHITDSHYILSDAKFPFEFSYAGQDVKTVEIAANNGEAITNNLKYGSVSGLKLDEDGKTIAGAKFGLFRNDEETYTEENAILIAESAQDGIFHFDNIPVGSWVVRELVPAEGFVLNGQSYQVTITEHEQVIEITLENRYIRSDILGHKVDEDGETIAGALFGLFQDGTEEFTEEAAFMTSESDENGIFRFEQIRYGNWIVKELRPAESFVPNEKLYKVTVEEDGAVIEFTVENKYIRGNVEGLKVDKEGNIIKGAVFGLFFPSETIFTAETALLTAESDSDGVFIFKEVLYGNWLIKELQPAENFLPNEELYSVQIAENDEVIEITVVNDRIPEIGTNAAVDGEKEIGATEVFTLEDTVSYRHLIPGKEYTVSGVLMDKSTGKPLLINGEEIHAETIFVPDAPTGEVIVSFTFDAKYIKTDTDIVVFESLYCDGKELAVHADIEDKNQTVSVFIPEIGTQASIEGSKESTVKDRMTIEDIVSYKNLTPGKEYTVKGVLMDKSTGKSLLINGKEIHSETTFIPKNADGEIILAFTFEGKYLKKTTEIVVFETLYREDIPIAVHADLEDQGQTVTVQVPLPPPSDSPQTGDTSHIWLWLALSVASGAAIILLSVHRRRYSK